MSWQEINKKYPKAWNIYMNWFSEQNYGENLDFAFNRDLYDFFDEQGIMGLIYANGFDLIDRTKDLIYVANEFLKWESDLIFQDATHDDFDRNLFEQLMFEKAFEILENKLKEWQ